MNTSDTRVVPCVDEITPHKHADMIKLWADGHKVEYSFVTYDGTRDWFITATPSWNLSNHYRIHRAYNDVRDQYEKALAEGKNVQVQVRSLYENREGVREWGEWTDWYDNSITITDALWEDGSKYKAYRVIEKEQRRLDWTHMPIDTVVNTKEFGLRHFAGVVQDGFIGVFPAGATSITNTHLRLSYCKPGQLVAQVAQEWKPHTTGRVPFSVGVIAEFVLRSGAYGVHQQYDQSDWTIRECQSDIIMYRILGVDQGWTE